MYHIPFYFFGKLLGIYNWIKGEKQLYIFDVYI